MRISYLAMLILIGAAFPITLIVVGPLGIYLVVRIVRDYKVAKHSLQFMQDERDILGAGKFFGS